MKIIFADDGSEIIADTFEDLVNQLRDQSPLFYVDNKSYMQNFARRAVIADNLDIRFTNEEDFIKDLEERGLIVIV